MGKSKRKYDIYKHLILNLIHSGFTPKDIFNFTTALSFGKCFRVFKIFWESFDKIIISNLALLWLLYILVIVSIEFESCMTIFQNEIRILLGFALFFFLFLSVVHYSFFFFGQFLYSKKQKKRKHASKRIGKMKKKMITNQVPQKTVQMTKQKNTEFTSWTLGLTWTQYAIPWARNSICRSCLIPAQVN